MKAKILRLGKGPVEVDIRVGSTVAMALEHANIPFADCYPSVNGAEASLDFQLSEGDRITLNPKVAGGIHA